MSIQIEFTELQKSYHNQRLYPDSFNGLIPSGCISCITGANGSGKSTLLKLLAGLTARQAGKISYQADGKALAKASVRQKLLFISPETLFYNSLSALENLRFFASLTDIKLTCASGRRILATAGLPDNKPVGEFSTGMQQRLKLALLLLPHKTLWLLDEPSSNLDDNGQQLVANLLKFAKKRHYTVVLATNEQKELAYASHRLILN